MVRARRGRHALPTCRCEAAFDHYRDYREKSLKLIKNARPFPE